MCGPVWQLYAFIKTNSHIKDCNIWTVSISFTDGCECVSSLHKSWNIGISAGPNVHLHFHQHGEDCEKRQWGLPCTTAELMLAWMHRFEGIMPIKCEIHTIPGYTGTEIDGHLTSTTLKIHYPLLEQIDIIHNGWTRSIR